MLEYELARERGGMGMKGRGASEPLGRREPGREPRPASKFMTLEVREGACGSPRMGALVGIGDPGATAMVVRVGGTSGIEGELYRNVAPSTIHAPATNEKVMG